MDNFGAAHDRSDHGRQFHAADDVADWRVLYHVISAHFRTGSLARGVALVVEIGLLASAAEQPRSAVADVRSRRLGWQQLPQRQQSP